MLAALDGATFDTAVDDAIDSEAARERIRGLVAALRQRIETAMGLAAPTLMLLDAGVLATN